MSVNPEWQESREPPNSQCAEHGERFSWRLEVGANLDAAERAQ
jgi:hypothetical protein